MAVEVLAGLPRAHQSSAVSFPFYPAAQGTATLTGTALPVTPGPHLSDLMKSQDQSPESQTLWTHSLTVVSAWTRGF